MTAVTTSSHQLDSTTINLTVTDIKAHGLPHVGWANQHGKYYVELILDQNSKKTAVSVRGTDAVWNDSFSFDTYGSSVLKLDVYAHHTFSTDDYIGGIKETVDILHIPGTAKAYTRRLAKYDSNGKWDELQATIEFVIASNITSSTAIENQMEKAITQGNSAVEQMKHASLLPVDAVGKAIIDNTAPVVDAWKPLLTKIELFTKIVDQIAEVHPYAKMAWTILSAAHKAIITQTGRDASVERLVEIMNDNYAFVHEAEPLKKIESHKQIVSLMIKQTTECAYFIRDYAKNKNFWTRTMKYLVSDVDNKIKQYEDKFNTLRSAFQEQTVLQTGITVHQTEITVLRILNQVENLTAEIDLNDMPYAEGAKYDPEKVCLPGTRQEIIEEICDWVNNDGDDVSRMFLLSGVAGSGKSAIAHTVAQRFDAIGRLGSSFCFDRSHQAERGPDNILSTIARDLADLDPQRKQCLWEVIRGKRALRTTHVPREQFEQFILKPTINITSVGPILIVIDALDESADPESRKILLSVLADGIANLPSNFRVLVTTRPEEDIQDAFGRNRTMAFKAMDSIDVDASKRDISIFIQKQLADVRRLDHKWPDGAWCRLLVEKSEGLFQWASTACQFIKGNGKRGLDPVEQLDILVSPASQNSHLNHLDKLYTVVLTQIFVPDNIPFMERFRSILGRVLAAKEPLPISALRELVDEQDIDGVELILRPLGSLLSGVAYDSVPIRPLHTSFRDFLTDRERSGSFFIDISLHQSSLTLACLRVMKKELQFNICKLETSHIRNCDIPDLAIRVKKAVSVHLFYACRFWANHLQAVPPDLMILKEIKDLMDGSFLYWLEVLSLMKVVHITSAVLSSVIKWVTTLDDDFVAFAMDALKYIAIFRSTISQSTPHIYLSTLAFAPEQSKVSQKYLPQFPQVISLRTGRATNWSVVQGVFEGHTGDVTSVVFSRDGMRIVSSSFDDTIRVWDRETGEVVSGPFNGGTGGVYSIALSPDGTRVASGSDDTTIRVWDLATGNVVSGPFNGHTGEVYSVAFSPDGTHIASGSADTTIRLWNAETGEVVAGPFNGHTDAVNSVAFSPDGNYIVSGSDDETIRVWNAKTGETVSGPFDEHINCVTSVAFSPDGTRIVSGSDDETIRVWDRETGKVVLGPFEGHTDRVSCVAFSPDGSRIVSGSHDNTIYIWDAETGKIISGPFYGHTNSIWSVAFSPDGTSIVSGSYDNTICIWNADLGQIDSSPLNGQIGLTPSVTLSSDGMFIASEPLDETACVLAAQSNEISSGPFHRHTKEVWSVAFSPDGTRIVSGSADETIYVWNADTGEYVLGPFNGHTDEVLSVAFSPDGTRIVSGSYDETIRLWDANTGEAVSEPFNKHTDGVRSVAFSPDGARLVSGSVDKTICVWDAKTGEVVAGPFNGHTDEIQSVAFSPDGKYIVSGSEDATIRVWDTVTGEVVSGPYDKHTAAVNSVAFSPDGTRIVSGSNDGTMFVWDRETGNIVSGPFGKNAGEICSAVFSPDGTRIVSGSFDKSIRVWDAQTGEVVSGPFYGHNDQILCVAISPNGKRIVSGSDDRTVRLWDVETNKVISGASEVQDGETQRCFNDSSILENGWLLDSSSALLFWVPPWNRPGLWRPSNTAIIGEVPTKLDFSHFVHGTSWEQCRIVT